MSETVKSGMSLPNTAIEQNIEQPVVLQPMQHDRLSVIEDHSDFRESRP